MAKTIALDVLKLANNLISMNGAAGTLTESPKLEPTDIEGMPASCEMVLAAEKLDNALKEFQDLINRDRDQFQRIATDLISADRASAGK